MRLAFALLALFGGMFQPRAASAHEMSMAEMQIQEVPGGNFLWQWTAGFDKGPVDQWLILHWPTQCSVEQDVLRCGESGLSGEFSIDGVGKHFSVAMVQVHWKDGRNSLYTLTAGQPGVRLFGSADDTRGWSEIAYTYLGLGVEHILTGYDHLLFVAGLLFLVGFGRKLIWTITAFTAAHSLTLASAALGWLTLRPPPVEACIALSIVLVAAEALNPRLTLARRYPAVLAFLFGLIHGLGFAGALKDVGLPANHLPVALLTFNLGVESGQLACVGAAWLVCRELLKRWPAARRARTPALYGIGTIAAYWSWLRIALLVG
ncbi:MAG: HupE/UreJ family protein [Pseudomonadota bacterium]